MLIKRNKDCASNEISKMVKGGKMKDPQCQILIMILRS